MTRKADIDIEKVKELRSNGVSVEDIAKEFNVHKSTMINFIRRENLLLPKLEIPTDELIELRDKGYTLEQLAEHFNCNRATVCRRIKKHKLYLEEKPLKDYLEERLIENPLTGCLEWSIGLDKDGYGKAWDRRKNNPIRAHRLAYEIYKGPIPKGLIVRHLCNNRKCCNPNHLDVGTVMDNFNDAREHGTMPKVKVTRELANEAIRLYEEEGWLIREIAKHFNVSETTIYRWKRGFIGHFKISF